MNNKLIKISAILLLIAVIVGISVIRTRLSSKHEETAIRALQAQYKKTQDSLIAKLVTDSVKFYTDSIGALQVYYRAEIDSLQYPYGIDSIEPPRAGSMGVWITRPNVARMLAEYDSLSGRLPKKMSAKERKTTLARLASRVTRKYGFPLDSLTQTTNPTQ
ncbi:MAG: hypothetical protein NTV06_07475 [candidate division Zixibacteria bacterium]|nr:hypothetical protein [candidate division Zixibacteria bacterium]